MLWNERFCLKGAIVKLKLNVLMLLEANVDDAYNDDKYEV